MTVWWIMTPAPDGDGLAVGVSLDGLIVLRAIYDTTQLVVALDPAEADEAAELLRRGAQQVREMIATN